MTNGRWQMANGKWQMINGKWQMANGRWQMADGKWLEIFSPSVICHLPFAMLDTIIGSTVPYYVEARSPGGRGTVIRTANSGRALGSKPTWRSRHGDGHLIDPAQRVADRGIDEGFSAFASASPSL